MLIVYFYSILVYNETECRVDVSKAKRESAGEQSPSGVQRQRLVRVRGEASETENQCIKEC